MIRNWLVLDLNVFRQFENDAGVRREIQDNGDGTHFIAYDILSFPPELILGTSSTMAVALEQGVDAVERLRPKYLDDLDERCRKRMEDAPDLQQLIRKYGGYSKIPAQAWAEWNRLNVAWQVRRRMLV